MRSRLAYVIGRYPAASHAFISREIEALRERGAEIETITIRPPRQEEIRSDADREEAASAYSVLPAGPLKLLGAHGAALLTHPGRYFATLAYALRLGRGARGRLWQLFYFAEAVVVWRRCRKLGLSHLHTHFADTGTDSALLATHLEPEWSFSITVHGPDEFVEAEQNRLSEKLRRARFAVAITDDAKRKAVAVAGEGEAAKIEVIRLGVDPERFDGRAGGPHPDRDAGLDILCLGRLVERKGHADLLRAVSALSMERLRVELTIAGDGPEREALEQLADELGISVRVRFTGVVSQDEAVELYRGADAFCLPSYSEGLPAVLMEAMACALPVVSTRIDGIPELVTDGVSGLLIEPGDVEGLAAALRRLAAHPELRTRFGEEGRRVVRERYELGRQADELLSLFRNRLQAPTRRQVETAGA